VLVLPWGRHVVHRADKKTPMGILMNHVVPRHAANAEVEFVIAHDREHALHNHRARADGDWGGQPAGAALAFQIEQHAPLALVIALCARWYQRRLWHADEARWLAALLGREVQHGAEKTSTPTPDAPPEVRAMVNFLEQHFQKSVRISELAQFAGRSESHVVKLFQRYVGMSPKQYLQRKRLARARELLHVSNLSVSEVGRAVGFTSPYHFSRAFSGSVGESPLAYRRRDLSL
jgi:AraC-like DNA-binding protein